MLNSEQHRLAANVLEKMSATDILQIRSPQSTSIEEFWRISYHRSLQKTKVLGFKGGLGGWWRLDTKETNKFLNGIPKSRKRIED